MTSFGLQTGLNPILQELFLTNASQCHPDYKYLICASVFYDCAANGAVREPCEMFCREVLLTPECLPSEDPATNRVDRFLIMETCSQYPSALDTNQKVCPAGEAFIDTRLDKIYYNVKTLFVG